jgi:nicotinate-nucleotide adenylyltransferase
VERLTMQNNFKRIGISGGTFDPVHIGHLIIAEEIREILSLDKIIFVPTGQPPHKDGLRVTEALHRYNMVAEAIKSNPFFEVSRLEVDRPGYTYTIDTLEHLKEIYGDKTRLYFITGADVVHELETWKEFERVFLMCEFVAVLRPGYRKNDIIRKIKSLQDEYNARMHMIDVPLIGISSTQIRQNLKNGRSIKYLVPEIVEKYIYQNGLYRQKEEISTDSIS